MKQNNPIFVISDLHLGSGGRRDNFSTYRKDKQFFDFLDYVEKNNGELIITGDLVDMWRFRIKRILRRYAELFDRLAEMNVSFIVGNHDKKIETLLQKGIVPHRFFKKTTKPFARLIGDKQFKFMHGHEIDPLHRKTRPLLGRIICLSSGALEWINGSYFHSAEKFENKFGLKKIRTKKLLARHQKYKNLYCHDIIICGHTHRVGRFKNWYFNSGSWLGETNNFLEIMTDGRIAIFDWTNSGPKINQTVLCA